MTIIFPVLFCSECGKKCLGGYGEYGDFISTCCNGNLFLDQLLSEPFIHDGSYDEAEDDVPDEYFEDFD